LNISSIFIKNKKYEKAIEVLTKGINKNPEASDLYYNRSCCYSILNMIELALADMKTSLMIDENLLQWYKNDKDFDNLRNNKVFNEIIQMYEE
ncbi:MAG TPA: hypothetical protein VIG40_08665, partial [Tissierellaceae bacterium]